jgi:hypothetical protein
VGSAGLVGFRVGSKVGKGVSNLSNLFSSLLWVVLDQK